jgi:hypothetical protein
MRTTLDIENDVLQAARERSKRERKSLGETVSQLIRKGLNASAAGRSQEPPAIHGLRPFPSRGGIVTNEQVNSLREDDAY